MIKDYHAPNGTKGSFILIVAKLRVEKDMDTKIIKHNIILSLIPTLLVSLALIPSIGSVWAGDICHDGVDQDGDGTFDMDDKECKEYYASQDKATQDTTGQDKATQDTTGQDTTGQDTTGQDTTGQDKATQDTTGQDITDQSGGILKNDTG